MKTIKCECGEEILLIPDLKAMGKAIENHLKQHHPIRNPLDLAKRVKLRHELAKQTLQVVGR